MLSGAMSRSGQARADRCSSSRSTLLGQVTRIVVSKKSMR